MENDTAWLSLDGKSCLMGKSCAETAAAVKQTSDYKADHSASAVIRKITKKDQFAAVEVVFRGVFKAARQGQCFGELCMRYEVETDELVSAQAPPG